VTINITSVPYHVELANRLSAEFRELADAVRGEVEHIYRDIPGHQSVNVLQFRYAVALAAASVAHVNLPYRIVSLSFLFAVVAEWNC